MAGGVREEGGRRVVVGEGGGRGGGGDWQGHTWGGVVGSALVLKVGSPRQDEQVSGDEGVVKHKLREGEGYEKATDGARLSFLYRIHAAPRTAGRVREAGTDDSAVAGRAGRANGSERAGLDSVYDKWAKLDITEDGDVIERVPESVEKALADADKVRGEQQASVLWESWDATSPCSIFCGFGETAEGLEDALVSMKKNEHAMVAVSAEYGFGAHDGPAPVDTLPTNSTLHFEILLLEISKGYEHWNLDVAGKREHANRKRQVRERPTSHVRTHTRARTHTHERERRGVGHSYVTDQRTHARASAHENENGEGGWGGERERYSPET
jgi:hypothetical protein